MLLNAINQFRPRFGQTKAEEENKLIRVRMILSIMRTGTEEACKELVDLAIKYKEAKQEYIVGIEMSGDPNAGEFVKFTSQLQRARESGVKISVHCAETKTQ